jgi:hypothetical protein
VLLRGAVGNTTYCRAFEAVGDGRATLQCAARVTRPLEPYILMSGTALHISHMVSTYCLDSSWDGPRDGQKGTEQSPRMSGLSSLRSTRLPFAHRTTGFVLPLSCSDTGIGS